MTRHAIAAQIVDILPELARDSKINAQMLIENLLASGEQQHYGVIDPDYARIYTVVRCLAWQEGYAAVLHGSFTRDLDILLIPWTDYAAHRASLGEDHLILRIESAHLGLKRASGPTKKPHVRLAWTLTFPSFGDPRFVDISILPPTTPSNPQAQPSDTPSNALPSQPETAHSTHTQGATQSRDGNGEGFCHTEGSDDTFGYDKPSLDAAMDAFANLVLPTPASSPSAPAFLPEEPQPTGDTSTT